MCQLRLPALPKAPLDACQKPLRRLSCDDDPSDGHITLLAVAVAGARPVTGVAASMRPCIVKNTGM